MGGFSIMHWLLLLVVVAIGFYFVRRRTPSDQRAGTVTASVGHSLADAPKASPENCNWRDIDTIILGVPCGGCNEMEGHAAEAPGLRTCKICGRRIELDAPWDAFVTERIESGLYCLVGNGRTLMMGDDRGAAMIGLRSRMVRLFGLHVR